ncbi:hypothetical protein ANRL4_04186 [Anaerolineae bacterium]|nr:hypothetical protein ANRL4_04186 [Anaerolineae bacterium]
MDIWLTILGGVLGIAGAFAGAWLANRYERRGQREQEKRDSTIKLYEEFQSPDTLQARIVARSVFTENLKKDCPLTINEMRENLDPVQWHAVSVVITFFERLGVLLKNDYLDQKLTKSLFAYDFSWWYGSYIERFVKEDDKIEAAWGQYIEYASRWLTMEKR